MMTHRRRSQYTLPIDSYILGWGIIIPLAVYVPYCILNAFDVQNRSVRMSTGSSAIIVAYRCVEAMYHTSPHTVEHNIFTYMVYYSSILHFQWNPSTQQRRPITIRELLVNTGYFICSWLLLSVLMSYAMHHKFLPFSSPIKDIQNFHFNSDIFDTGHIANMYLLAVLTYLTLSFGLEITSLGEQVKGYYTEPIFSNPLFTSRSPSDFWNRKWNNMIHTVLKYGTFYPAQQYMSNSMALFATFIMSGIIHEYIWSLIFYQHPDSDVETTLYVPTVFKLTAFFAWNGIVMLFERPLKPYVRPLTTKLPSLVASTLVVFTALPVAHWYVGDWAVGELFGHLSFGLWVIRKL
jgi:Membrane bound O-acyl transferase family